MGNRLANLRARVRRGFTLMELMVCVTVAGILITFVAPSFVRVTEQNRVDASAQYLRSIWSAQRVYWLENRTFAPTLSSLSTLGLIDAKIATGDDGFFNYVLDNVTDSTFTVNATRHGSSVWSGSMHITQIGDVTGFISGSGSTVLTPPDI